MDDLYPITPYTFEVDTAAGFIRIDLEPAEYDEPSAVKLTPALAGYQDPERELKGYFSSFGFGMRGVPVGLDIAVPADIHHVLLMSQTYHQGKQSSIRGFEVIEGFIRERAMKLSLWRLVMGRAFLNLLT